MLIIKVIDLLNRKHKKKIAQDTQKDLLVIELHT